MPAYTKVGPFTNGGSPGISKAFLDGVETQLAAVQYGVNILATPYALAAGASISSGSTTTYTCTGGSTGVPAGAKAIFVNLYFNAAGLGTYVVSKPHSASPPLESTYPEFGANQVANSQSIIGCALLPIDSNGQLDIKASNGAITNLVISMYAYVY